MPTSASPRTFLGVSRLAVGAATLLAPSAAVRAFGVDPARSDPWLTRLFGARELVLAGLLLGARGTDVRSVALVGAAIDGVDVLSSAAETARGTMSARAIVTGGGGAVLFAVLGLLAAREV
jgi:hypothetical protein